MTDKLGWLVALYPRWWRRRYGTEYAALLADLRAEGRGRWRIAIDAVAGAVDAHLHPPPTAGPRPAATRIGLRRGALASLVIAIVVVMTNVVRPGHGDDGAAVFTGYGLIMLVLARAGYVAGTRIPGRIGPPVAGATAGAVIAVLTIATFFAVDNLFLDVVGQQQVKIDGLARSHLGSMRRYVNVTVALAGLILVPFLTACGCAFGAVGGTLGRRRAAARRSATRR